MRRPFAKQRLQRRCSLARKSAGQNPTPVAAGFATASQRIGNRGTRLPGRPNARGKCPAANGLAELRTLRKATRLHAKLRNRHRLRHEPETYVAYPSGSLAHIPTRPPRPCATRKRALPGSRPKFQRQLIYSRARGRPALVEGETPSLPGLLDARCFRVFCRTMKRMICQLIGATALFLAASAETEEVTDLDRFQLWNDCAPVDLVVAGLNKDAADIGLTRQAIETAVRSRLRAARLFDANKVEYLYVRVTVVGRAFSMVTQFKKRLYDSASTIVGTSPTWEIGSTGTRGQNSGYILSLVSQDTDEFIDEYLRVNEEACTRGP